MDCSVSDVVAKNYAHELEQDKQKQCRPNWSEERKQQNSEMMKQRGQQRKNKT